jgi:hypothetical protein
MKTLGAIFLGMAWLAANTALARPQKDTGEFVTEEEQDKLREAHEPSERIQLYVEMEQLRLERFETFRSKPADPAYDTAAYLDRQLVQFIGLNEELKGWIDDQYDRNGDIRKGLRVVLEKGALQLEQLRRAQQAPDTFAPAYTDSLRDAIEDLTDTLDGAAKAMGDQEKKFGALKREEKADAQDAKERAKEEKKRTKEEEKLRKKEHKSGAPGDSDQN